MSVFDSIMDGVTSIGDWVADEVMDIADMSASDLLKGGFRAYSVLSEKNKAKQAAASKYGMDNVSLASVNNSFKAGETQFGVQNFAPDPGALEQYWGQVIQKFIQTSKTGGK